MKYCILMLLVSVSYASMIEIGQKLNVSQLDKFEYSHNFEQEKVKKIEFNTLKGKPTLLKVWSHTCGGCLKTIQTIVPIYAQQKNKLNILAITYFNSNKELKAIEKTIDDLKVNFPGVIYNRENFVSEIKSFLDVKYTPYIVVLSSDLTVLWDGNYERLARMAYINKKMDTKYPGAKEQLLGLLSGKYTEAQLLKDNLKVKELLDEL